MNIQSNHKMPKRRHLAPNRWRQRYIRQRQQDPVVQMGLGKQPFSSLLDSYEPLCEEDTDWDYDPYEYCYGYDGSLSEYAVLSCLEEMFLPQQSRFSDLQAFLPAREPTEVQQPEQQVSVEERVFEFSRFIQGLLDGSIAIDELRTVIRHATAAGSDIEGLRRAVGRPDKFQISREGAIRLLLFAPFWVRKPDSWDGQGDCSLFSHLSEQFDAPLRLQLEWNTQLDLLQLKWIIWHLILSQGGSLKRASRLYNWQVSSKFQHFLYAAPDGLSPLEMSMHAEVSRLGGDTELFNRLCGHWGYVIDPTEITDSESFRRFWFDTVKWLVNNGRDITNQQCDDILDWAHQKYHEPPAADATGFSWKGRRVGPVLEQSAAYAQLKLRPWVKYSWSNHGYDCCLIDETGQRWSVEEICSGQQLYREGRELHHCVVNYAATCAAGDAIIFSLRKQNVRHLTLQLDPSNFALVQARGLQNRHPTGQEKRVINQWISLVF